MTGASSFFVLLRDGREMNGKREREREMEWKQERETDKRSGAGERETGVSLRGWFLFFFFFAMDRWIVVRTLLTVLVRIVLT